MYNPKEDGLTHINIYSKGLTELGRLLSNFAFTPFKHPRHGHFSSVEGYWFWLQTDPGFKREALRLLSGALAKSWGTSINRGIQDNVYFKMCIEEALEAKCYQHYNIYKSLKNSSLPFTHYYTYGNKKVEAGFDWLVDFWEKRRKILHEEEK